MLVVERQSGVSLVEILIGVAIMGMLFAYGVPSFRDWIQNTQIRNGAEAIQSGLQLARAEAIRRNSLVQLVGNVAGNSSWTVSCVTVVGIDQDGDGKIDCPGAGTNPNNIQAYTSAEGARNALVAGVNVPMVAGLPTIVFNGLGRVTPLPATDIRIDISNPVGGNCIPAGTMRCLSILVSTGGQIRMCDPAVAYTAATPQGC